MRRMAFAFACTLPLSGPALGAAGDVLTVLGDRVNVRAGPSTGSDVRMQVSRNQRLVEIAREGDWVHAEISGTGGAEGWIHASFVAPADGQLEAPAAGRKEVPDQATTSPPAAGPAPVADSAPTAPPFEDADAAAAETESAAGASMEAPLGTGDVETAAAIAPGAAAEVDAVDLQRFRDSIAYLNERSKLVGGVDLFAGVEPVGGGVVQVSATDAWADVPPAGQRSYASALLERWAAATGRADRLTVQIVDPGGQVIMEESTR